MHGIPLLRDLVILVAVAIPVVLLMQRLRLPTIIGFLVAGVALGPSALGAIRNVEQVSVLAEIGVVLLLFSIGLELSLSRIIRMGRLVLTAGTLQLVFTMAGAAIIAAAAGEEPRRAVVWGVLIALSSTAIVLKLYQDRGELDAPHGKVVVAILLFQDLCVVPLMLLLPLLAGGGDGAGTTITRTVTSVIVVSAMVAVGRWAVPWLLERVASTRVQELFTLSVVAIGLGAAFLTSAFGLSLALGALPGGFDHLRVGVRTPGVVRYAPVPRRIHGHFFHVGRDAFRRALFGATPSTGSWRDGGASSPQVRHRVRGGANR